MHLFLSTGQHVMWCLCNAERLWDIEHTTPVCVTGHMRFDMFDQLTGVFQSLQ